jgi:hypothetical protein
VLSHFKSFPNHRQLLSALAKRSPGAERIHLASIAKNVFFIDPSWEMIFALMWNESTI